MLIIQGEWFDVYEMVEFEVSGDQIEAVYMIPGWTHNIINLSEAKNLVTVMTCNEVFDKRRPDTFGEVV
jgi:capsular polysaccharide biosynthesis protein cap5F